MNFIFTTFLFLLLFQDFSKSSARYLYKNGVRLGSKSSPASPTKQEPQCTCLVNEKQNSRLRMSSANRGMLYVQYVVYSMLRTTKILLCYWYKVYKVGTKTMHCRCLGFFRENVVKIDFHCC